MKKLTILMMVMLFSVNAYARNSGETAINCVNVSNGSDKVTFSNNCGEPVFVFWCGDLKYSGKKCGDGGSFFNMSRNIAAGSETTADIVGNYRWGACKGSISFGHDEFEDYPNGGFKCLPR